MFDILDEFDVDPADVSPAPHRPRGRWTLHDADTGEQIDGRGHVTLEAALARLDALATTTDHEIALSFTDVPDPGSPPRHQLAMPPTLRREC